MAATLGSFASLAARLSDAPDTSALVRAYLAGARELTGVPGLGFDLFEPPTRRPLCATGSGVSDYFLARYETVGRAVDPVLAEVVRRRAPVTSAQLMPAATWREHDVFRAVYGIHDFAGVLQAPAVRDGAVIGVLSFGARSAAIGAGDVETGAALATVVASALAELRHREQIEHQCAAAQEALDVCDQAVVITDIARGERRMNRAARALLARVAAPWALDDALARARDCGAGPVARERVELAEGGSATLRIQTAPSAAAGGAAVSILAFDRDAAQPLPASVAALLTRREGEVASRAAAGLHNDEIARALELSPHTVKQYLKTAFRKLGVSSRVELARLLSG